MSSTQPAPSPQPASSPQPRRTILLAGMWVVSLVLAFLFGNQMRPLGAGPTTPATAPAAPTAAPQEPAASSAPATPDPQLEQFLLDLPRRTDGDPMALGATDAKVVLTNWSDYRCPFCALWHQQTLPQLQRYVDDGSLRIEFRDLAIFGEQSVNAAVAARAAGQQGKFWEYQDAVFAAAPSSGHPELPREKLVEFATTTGVPDLAAFEAALDDPALAQAVQADSAEAQQFGISGTPFFVIGGQVLNGAQPAEVFDSVIRSELER